MKIVKIISAIAIVLAILVGGFYALNSYIYKEKQAANTPNINATTTAPIVAENPDGEADPARMKLDMKPWIWLSNEKFVLTFTEEGNGGGRFSAKTDCNNMGGNYVFTKQAGGKGTITFSEIFSTQMYCEGSREGEFAAILSDTNSYSFNGRGQMILGLKSSTTSAMFR